MIHNPGTEISLREGRRDSSLVESSLDRTEREGRSLSSLLPDRVSEPEKESVGEAPAPDPMQNTDIGHDEQFTWPWRARIDWY